MLRQSSGRQVVQDVVDRHHPDESVVVVHDGQRDEVVGRELARDLGEARVRAQRLEAVVEERAEALVRRVAQHPLEVHDAEEAAGRRLVRRQSDAHRRGLGRGELVAADEGEALGDRRVGGDDDRLRRHEAARGVLAVGEQEAHVLRLLGLHELEQRLAALGAEVGDEVGGVVRLHLVEHLGGAVVAEPRDDVGLVLLGHLLEHVGEALVRQLPGDLDELLGRQVEQRARGVGRGHLRE